MLLDAYSRKRAQTIKDHILNTFTAQSQTIEEHINNDNNDHVIVDELDHVMSFECPIVVYVREWHTTHNNDFFNITSRARTRLHIIDIDVNTPPIITTDVNIVEWYVKDKQIVN